jgi:hypothetical protein
MMEISANLVGLNWLRTRNRTKSNPNDTEANSAVEVVEVLGISLIERVMKRKGSLQQL